ncbi:TIGR02099 family protein [Luteibacter aegosomatis]|uniref:YhdP family protein n=1 Tax=Luteibacter aegosomatis TaxID=2911537 RepID=UPI001FFC0AD0|nr:YhdP family protein [Luteibacter aegosomatis]UPG84887.1 TIGR02099 family protein [Luteibacter aegosomatis]
MNPAWRHRIRRLRFFLVGLVASVLVALAIAMALGQLLLPLAARYPGRVAATLSEKLGRPVTFASLEGFWQPSGPLFVMRDVSVAGENGGAPLHLPRAALKLDFGGLVLPSRHLLNLRLTDLHLGLRRAADGRWSVDGFAAGGASQKVSLGQMSADLWLGNLRLDIADEGTDRHYGLVADQLRISMQGHVVRAGGTLRRENGGGLLTTAARFADDGSSGTVYLKGSQVDFAALTSDIEVGGYTLAKGRGGFETWVQWRDAHVARSTSRIDLDGLKVRGPDRMVSTEGLHGLFDMHADATGTERRFDWAGSDGSDVALLLHQEAGASRGTLVARHLELAPLVPWAGVLPQLSPAMARWLGEGHPRGRFDEARADWDSSGGLHAAHATFSGLGIDASGRLPGVSSLHGEIFGDGEAMALSLPHQATVLDATGTFRKPFAMSSLGGDIAVYQDDDGWHIGIDPLDFRGEGFGGQARGEFVLPSGDGGPFMDMYVALGEGEVPAAKLFWPVHSMSEGAQNWLNRGLVSGHIRGGSAVFRGNLRDFPFRNQEGRFEARADIDDLVLDYGNGWPRAEGVTAVASFIDNGMLVDASEGHSLGNAVSHATAEIADFADSTLDLRVNGVGTGASYLDFVKNSPVGTNSREALDRMQLGGSGEFGFNLLMPLKNAKDFTLDGKATIRDADLVADAWKLRLDKITGDMSFDGKGFRATGLKTAFRGQPATLDLAIAGGTDDPSKIVAASVQGAFTVEELVSGYDNLKWLGDIAKGRGPFRVGFELARASQGEPTQTLTVDSDLRGVELRMPTPVKKPATQAEPLSVRVGLPVDGAQLDIALGDVVRGRLRLPDEPHRVPLAAAFNLGSGVPSTMPPEGYLIGGHASHLDVSGWVQYVVGMSTGNDGPGLYGLDLTTDDGEVFAQHFSNMHLVATPGPRELSLRVDSDGMVGQLTVPNDDLRRRGITARMDKLWWPAADDAADAAKKGKAVAGAAATTAATVAQAEEAGATKKPADANEAGVAPSSLPPLHLHVTDMRLGKAKLGEARLETWPTDEGMHIDQLRAQSKQVQITASGDWNGDDKHSRTHLTIDFAAEDVARMFDALGFAGILQGGRTSARLDAIWPGGPSALALANMNGSLKIDIANGRILEVQPGVGRLFGLVSVTELPRRLGLDFGDVLGKGFGFDSITGDFQFADGTATTQNLKIRGPAAEISITGRTGLRARDYDQQLLVVPHVGNSLPVVGALAGGPVGAAAGLAVQGILGHGLNQAARKRYHIGGTWDKPVITPVDKDVPSAPQKP